eukprot:TRINITY_DN20790_c0_g1_i2.p1 TRINITY_DN20790_c0_g1~~TRINITY_DN20790_c0_g1_i2.p1  ORF type:complete len:767 (+),score=111.39 TRINITY_DN20790_c0_g1_i2:81-2381(+)
MDEAVLRCPGSHPLHLTHLPCVRNHRCTICQDVIPRAARRFMCRWCSYDVCYDCAVHNIGGRSSGELVQARKPTLRSAFKAYAAERSLNTKVGISMCYDIVSPAVGEVQTHQHRRGSGVNEDCRYAVFSDALMFADGEVPTMARVDTGLPEEILSFASSIVRRMMALVDVVAEETSLGQDALDISWKPRCPDFGDEQLLKTGYLSKRPTSGHLVSSSHRRYFQLRKGALEWRKNESGEILGKLQIQASTHLSRLAENNDLRVSSNGDEIIVTGEALDEWEAALQQHIAYQITRSLHRFGTAPALLKSKQKELSPASGDAYSTALENPTMLAWLLEGDAAPANLSTTTTQRFAEKIKTLCHAATSILQGQSILSEVQAPVRVFGDLHGQLRDLLLSFHYYGRPTEEDRDHNHMSYVFNGDWVDRGAHQLELMVFLFALKILYPTRVWLNRGNHEDRQQNNRTTQIGSIGFDKACSEQLGGVGEDVFCAFQQVFEWLPLASRIEEKILVLHGGLGQGDWTLAELKAVQRPLSSENLPSELGGAVYNILWSDPLRHTQEARKNPLQSFGVHDSPRDKHFQIMKNFGRDVTERFCAREGLDLVIRSHQFTSDCKGYELMHDGRLLRVFSARNYMGTVPNDGGTLLIAYGSELQGGAQKELLLVRPQSIERLTRQAQRRSSGGYASSSKQEPYCPRKHMMQLEKPEMPTCFGWSHRDTDENKCCSECGEENLQHDCYFHCRGCSNYDAYNLCMECGARLASGLPALPVAPD